MVFTPSLRPIVFTSLAWDLNWNDDERAATWRSRMRVRALRISSATPSQKYAWSFSGLRSRNGRTAIEGISSSTPHSGSGAVSRRIPRGVMSYTQASTKAMGNPATTTKMRVGITHPGKPSGSKVTSPICRSIQPTIA